MFLGSSWLSREYAFLGVGPGLLSAVQLRCDRVCVCVCLVVAST